MLVPWLAQRQLVSSDREAVRVAEWGDHQTGAIRGHRFLFIGAMSYYKRPEGGRPAVRFVDESVYPMSAAELARPYLNLCFDEQRPARMKRVPWRRSDWALLAVPPVVWFAGPCEGGDLVYVDLRAAHWNIIRWAGLDVVYQPGRRAGAGRIAFLEPDEIAGHKGIRTCISGLIRSTGARVWSYGVEKTVPTRNRFLAPRLWGYLAHTLHLVAREAAESFGCCYFRGDGAIFRSGGDAERWMDHLARAWGLEGYVKARGPGQVWTSNQWKIGRKATRTTGGLTSAHGNLVRFTDDEAWQLRASRDYLLTR